jgi:geranylgeranyl diphosphate synthase type II
LNLLGDPDRYGKELNGDIQEGKRTLMLIHLLQHASPADRVQLAEILGRPRHERTLDEVEWVRSRMDTHGSIAYAQQVAHGLAGAAQDAFDEAFVDVPRSRERSFLRAVVRWVLTRT